MPRCDCNVQLQFSQNSQVGLQDLLAGQADVAFGRADITADMVKSQKISSRDIFKCVTSVSSEPPVVRGCCCAHGGRLVDYTLMHQAFTFVLLCHLCNIGHPRIAAQRSWVGSLPTLRALWAACVQNLFATALCCPASCYMRA